MHSKYDNIYSNKIFYALIFINNHVIKCLSIIIFKETRTIQIIEI